MSAPNKYPRRKYQLVGETVSQMCDRHGITYDTFKKRIQSGMSDWDALNTPPPDPAARVLFCSIKANKLFAEFEKKQAVIRRKHGFDPSLLTRLSRE